MGKSATLQNSPKKTYSVPKSIDKRERVIDQETPFHPMLRLQQTVGNQAVLRMLKSGAIQTKLKINEPGDKYEQEADRIADEVVRMPDSSVQRQTVPEQEEEETIQTKPNAEQVTPLVQGQVDEIEEEEEEILQTKPISDQYYDSLIIQRECAGCASGKGLCSECADEESVQRKPLVPEITPLIQRQEIEEEEEEELQAKEIPGNTPVVTPHIEDQINALWGGGGPLPQSVRSFFEPRFGVDFSSVRIHTDSQAGQAARDLRARAFTNGENIAFAGGQYAPHTFEGRKLLAHELTHTLQQNATVQSNRGGRVSNSVLPGRANAGADSIALVATRISAQERECVEGEGGQSTPWLGPPLALNSVAPTRQMQWLQRAPASMNPEDYLEPDEPDLVLLMEIKTDRNKILFLTQRGATYVGKLRSQKLPLGRFHLRYNCTEVEKNADLCRNKEDTWVVEPKENQDLRGRGLRLFDLEECKPNQAGKLDKSKCVTDEKGQIVDIFELDYANPIELEVSGPPPSPRVEMSIEKRFSFIEAFVRGTGVVEDDKLIRLIAETPLEHAEELLQKLKDEEFNGDSFLAALDDQIDGDNNIMLHAALSELRLKALGSEKGAELLGKALVLPWHKTMDLAEVSATFSVAKESDGKIRVIYTKFKHVLARSEHFGHEIKRLPRDLFVELGGHLFEPDEVVIIHDYDSGRFVTVVAQELIGYQHALVRGTIADIATVAQFALPVSAARTTAGKVAVIALERILPAAVALVRENRLNLIKWFPKWGPRMIYYAELVQKGLDLYGATRFAVDGIHIFRSWKKVRNSRASLEPDARLSWQKLAKEFERQADDMIEQAEKIHRNEASTSARGRAVLNEADLASPGMGPRMLPGEAPVPLAGEGIPKLKVGDLEVPEDIARTSQFESTVLDQGEIEAELDFVLGNPQMHKGAAPNRKVTIGKHTWHEEPNGVWCRHSKGEVCVVPGPRKVSGTGSLKFGDPKDGYVSDRIFMDWIKKPIPSEGWKIHVTATPESSPQIADIVLPKLRSMKVNHKVVNSPEALANMKGTQGGKFITIYPDDAVHAKAIAKALDGDLSGKGLKGLAIGGEKPIGSSGLLSTRYGAFTKSTVTDPSSGKEVPDVRGKIKPDWIEDPWARETLSRPTVRTIPGTGNQKPKDD